MSTPATVVSEILAELGANLADELELSRALERARDQHSLAPAGWARVERTLLGLRRRGSTTPARSRDRWLPRVLPGGTEADA